MTYDVLVIGGGHAGCEAALAAARRGCRTLLVTPDPRSIARMSCNPAIGGVGKGHLVREIDALGGEIGAAADDTGIQFRLLNRSRGPAVRGPRCQSDREVYAARMRRAVERQPRLDVLPGLAAAVVTESAGGRRRVVGITLADGRQVTCAALVVTAGTFLRGRLHVGRERAGGGRIGEPAAVDLSESLAALGLRRGRLKTGTSPRLALHTIDRDRLVSQDGDASPVPFSFVTRRIERPQILCWQARTNHSVHELVRAHLERSPLFDGSMEAAGPRYCPSLEEKVVRFAARESHPLILEPEGHASDVVYVNGLSTSLPADVQERIVHSIDGLQHAEILRPGYAVEYDYFDPRQLDHGLQVRGVEGLFLAGQIDGTTGYEEAAGLGILAGINAATAAGAGPGFTPSRSEAYLGVLVDDLVTRGTREPYRMFTSRAEYRLLLDIDSAERGLTPHGRRLGLVDDRRWEAFQERRVRTDRAWAWLGAESLSPSREARRRAASAGVRLGRTPLRLDRLLARPGVDLGTIESIAGGGTPIDDLDDRARGYLECRAKYDGYLQLQEDQVRRRAGAEQRRIPDGFRFGGLGGLSAETVEKLEQVRPRTLGQASRIPGLTAAAIALLDIHLTRAERHPPTRAVSSPSTGR